MRRIFQAIIALITVGTSIQTHSEDTAPRTLKVAAVLGLTGNAAVHAANIRNGVELAAKELRERGWTIDLRFEDDQTNAAKTVSAFQQLITQGYKLFIGPTWDFQANALRGSMTKWDAVALAPAMSSDVGGGPIEGLFNLSPQRDKGIQPLVELLKRHNSRRAYILTVNGPWGVVHRTLFRKAVEEAGGSVVGEEQFDYGIDAATSRTLVLKAKRVDAEVLFTTGASSDSANIVRARNAVGLTFKIIGTEDMQDAVSTKLLDSEDLRQSVFAMMTIPQASLTERYRAQYGEDPGVYSDRGYDALMVLAEASLKSDGSPKAIRALLKSGAEFSSTSERLSFNQQGDVATGAFEVRDLSAR